MVRNIEIDDQLTALASHLSGRRAAIMETWRNAVEIDPLVSSAASLPRAQLNDHIPHILEAFERELRASATSEHAAAKEASHTDAVAHGLHRWQQGYNLREVTREWGHLQLCLVDELKAFALNESNLDLAALAAAYRALAKTCCDGVSDSTAQYFQLQQVEAAGNVRDLEHALGQVRELERKRAELWRQAAHDLRGNLGVVSNVTTGLATEGVPPELKQDFLRVLKKNVASLHAMLNEVMSLARLQAGQEHREVKVVDVAAILRDLSEAQRSEANAKGLWLKTVGPDTLVVDGDSIKIQRIAQNLLVNALKYTRRGGVTVRWGDSRSNDPERWMLCVEDSGPGFHAGPGAPLTGALEEATEEARQVEIGAAKHGEQPPADQPITGGQLPFDDRPVHQEHGEGIGLSIVKRLSELLDATVEIQSTPNEGTTIRVLLPRSYAKAENRSITSAS